MKKSKVCTKCGEEKVLEEFNKAKRGKYGRTAKCKACRKAYREANKDKIAARQKAWREANKEAIAEYKKAWYEENKEEVAAWHKAHYKSNKEKINARNKKYYKSNKDKELARSRARYKANRDKELARSRARYKANKEKIAAYISEYKNKRYAEDPEFRTMCLLRAQTRRLGDYKSSSTIEIIGISAEEFWRRNGSPSAEQMEDLHIDHIVPLSWFDLSNEDHVRVSSHWTNFQYLSDEDNRAKGNRYAGRPDAILGYKEDFDIQKHVKDMIQFLNETNNF